MMFWFVAALFMAGVLWWLVHPFFSSSRVEVGESEYAISIYRDQAAEIEADLSSGLIGEEEAKAAEKEIERRALKAARSFDNDLLVSRRLPKAAALCAAIVLAGSFGIYLHFGSPGSPDRPLVARKMEVLEKRAAAGDMQSRVALLTERIKKEPESFEHWWMLAQAYSTMKNYPDAVDAYKKALELSNDNIGVLTAYAEALVLANGNRINQTARIAFEQVRRKRPNDPRARYYLALALAQKQDFEGALAAWVDLKNESKPDAPWLPLVRRDIVNMARFLKIDLVSVLPDASEEEKKKVGVAAATPEETQALAGRAEHLEKGLKTNPKDYKALLELAQVRAKLGRVDMALEALKSARSHYSAAPFIMQKIDQTARSLGLDIAEAGREEKRGPSQEDVTAASVMSDEDRNDMISGMVEGLAARLEEQPDDANGWMMLIRSYSVLNAPEKARKALISAQNHFQKNGQVLAQLSATAQELGISGAQ